VEALLARGEEVLFPLDLSAIRSRPAPAGEGGAALNGFSAPAHVCPQPAPKREAWTGRVGCGEYPMRADGVAGAGYARTWRHFPGGEGTSERASEPTLCA